MPDLEANTRSVVAFYELMFNACRPRDAVERDVGAESIQHNPHVESGKDGFIAYFERMAAESPGTRVTFHRVLAEENSVVLHCHQKWPAGLEYAGIDIFRLDERGKIVEHGDLLQEMPRKSAHNDGVF